MALNITNCPKCGRLMQKGLRQLCPTCHQEIEDQYEKCWQYLKHNRKCTLSELSRETGVSTALITRFIREGRISIADYGNLSYECELCGALIRESHLCEACRRKLIKDVQHLREDERRKSELAQKERGIGYLKDRI